ncbi:hypothetical protein V6N13_059716 [Hibiscus sabdariffa]
MKSKAKEKEDPGLPSKISCCLRRVLANPLARSSNNGVHREEEEDEGLSAAFFSLFSHQGMAIFSKNVPTSHKCGCPFLYIGEPPTVLCPKAKGNIPSHGGMLPAVSGGSHVGVGLHSCPFSIFFLLHAQNSPTCYGISIVPHSFSELLQLFPHSPASS